MENTVTIKELKEWLGAFPEDTKLGYLIEDEVVELHIAQGLGHFCLASGASHIKGKEQSDLFGLLTSPRTRNRQAV